MNRSFYARYAWLILIVAAVPVPAIVWGTIRAFQESNNNVSQWLPQDFPETETYRNFRTLFGADDFVLISWEGCTLDDPRLEELAGQLVPPPEQHGADDGTEYFAKVITGPRMLDTLTGLPFKLSRDEALKRLEGTLIGQDGKSTCAVITLSELGDTDRCKTLAALADIAVQRCGLNRDELHLGGDTVFNAAIDTESRQAVRKWIGLSILVALAVAWLCLRRARLMVMIFVVSVYGAGVATATIYYTGGQMNLAMVMVPVLVYVLTLSASVHLCNYYRDVLRESGPAGAPIKAMAAGWMPCMLSAVTTALGLGSLYVSHVVPVKMFGFYSAVGILLSLGTLFLLLPAMMEIWPLSDGSQSAASRLECPTARRDRFLGSLAGFMVRFHRSVIVVCLVLMVFCGCGVALIKTSVRPIKFFHQQSKCIQDYRWLCDRIGAMTTSEVVLCIDKDSRMTLLEQIELVDNVEKEVGAVDYIDATLSAATFVPSLDESAPGAGRAGRAALKVIGMRNTAAMRRRILDKRLAGSRDVLIDHRYLYENSEQTFWRITARAAPVDNLDYDYILKQVQQRVDTFLQNRFPNSEHVTTFYTGSTPLVLAAQRELLAGLFKSFCLAFVLIVVVMVLLLRNVSTGMVVMLPNVFPAVVTFGTMGLAGGMVDVGAMMTASVALGIAVDDTLHFMAWFRRAMMRGQTRQSAIVEAYRRCAPAMTHTTLIAGLAMLVFAVSAFQPVAQFGLLIFILLAAALVGDLVLLPALLATRVGDVAPREV